ncbi:MAG: hypothetical protein P8Y24_02055 [Gammaproteobacteria bacterium]
MYRVSALIFLSLFLHGCAYLQSLNSELPQQIDEWAAAHEYGKALNTLSYVSKNHKHYASLQKKKHKIMLQAKEFEHDQHLAARKMEQQGKWRKADNVYSSALNKFPQSKLLNTEYKAFKNRRNKYLKDLEYKLSIARGTWLIESTPLQKKILEAAPDNYASQQRFNNNTQKLQETAGGLMECAETALKTGRISLAKTCIQTAENLNSPDIDKVKLAKLKKQFSQSHQLYMKKQNDITRALLKEIKQGYSHDNLQRAQRHLSEIVEYKKQNKEAAKLAKELDKYIKTGLAQRMEAGRRMYSDGKYEEALSIWIPLKSIDPDNAKLQDYIERTKRVLKKLEKLSNTPSAITLPR